MALIKNLWVDQQTDNREFKVAVVSLVLPVMYIAQGKQ